MRVVFADPAAHALCADAARATAVWGAGWTAVAVCLSLLINSSDVADLRRWAAIDVRVTGGLIWIHHRDAVVTLAPLTDDGTVVDLDEEDAVEELDRIRHARVVNVACNGTPADRRTH